MTLWSAGYVHAGDCLFFEIGSQREDRWMKIIRLLGAVLFGTVVSSGSVGRSVAMPVAKDVGAAANDSVIDVRAARGGGGRAHVARASGSASRGNVNTRRNTNVNKRTNVNVNRRTNVNVVG